MVVALATILVFGSSYFSYSVAVAAALQTLVLDAMTAAYGSSSYYSSAADLAATEAVMDVAVAATMAVTNFSLLLL